MNYVVISYGTYFAGFNANDDPWFTMNRDEILLMTNEEAIGTLTLINSMGYDGIVQPFVWER